jgi:hypothetical protein
MIARLPATAAVALTIGATVLVAPGASALMPAVTLTEVCASGGPSNHVTADENFSGLGPSASYHVEIDRPAVGAVSTGNELGWQPAGDGTHVARVVMEVTGTDPVARPGETYHWFLKQSPSGGVVFEGDATVAAKSCVVAAPNTAITSAKIRPARHKATFTFRGIGSTRRFQCKLKKRHHTASWTSCTSPKTYRHLHGRYKFFVRAIGPGGTDTSPAVQRFRI